MIKETLEAIRGTQSIHDVARQLGIGPEDLRQRLKVLEDRGFIQAVGIPTGCAPADCVKCHCPGCSPGASQGESMYVLTEKGKKVLDRA